MASIFVNFSENNNHGCDQFCPFCEWSKRNYGHYYYPSDEDLDKLHQALHEHENWQLSGGGEPLYNFEKNKDLVYHICDYAHQLGHNIQLLTHKVDVVCDNYEELSKHFDSFYFSVGKQLNPDLVRLCEMTGEKFNINIVLNLRSDEVINWEEVREIYERYKPYAKFIAFRNNFIHPMAVGGKEERFALIRKFKEIDRHITFRSDVNVLCLFEGELLRCKEIDKKYLSDDK